MDHYITSNFDIFYKKQKYKIKTTVEIELLRRHYYQLLSNKFASECIDIPLNEKKLLEIFAYFIINSKNVIDPILTDTPNFQYSFIENIIKNNVRDNYPMHALKLKRVLKAMESTMKSYYKEFITSINKLNKSFVVERVIQQDLIILSLKQESEFIIDIPDISFSIHISLYKHLLKLYSIRNYGIYDNIDVDNPWIEFDEIVFILYCRYNYLFSGSTQASIPAQFKKRLLELLNIKVELFASAINSSYTIYCSLFYDVEQFFGSLGSFFDTEIKAGYYEANPPFEKNIIHNMFTKMSHELFEAEKNSRPLLFFIIIPKMNLLKIAGYKKMIPFLKFEQLLDKSNISYVYYDPSFSYAITRNIIDTYVLIFHTSHIKEAIKRNVPRIKSFL